MNRQSLRERYECLYKNILDVGFTGLVSPQLHMGKQAEEQQKYGERVNIPLLSSFLPLTQSFLLIP